MQLDLFGEEGSADLSIMIKQVKDMWRLTESRYDVYLKLDEVIGLLKQDCFSEYHPYMAEIERGVREWK